MSHPRTTPRSRLRFTLRTVGRYLLVGVLLTTLAAWTCALVPRRPLSTSRWSTTRHFEYPTETGLTERRWGWDIRTSAGDRTITRIESWCFSMSWCAPPASESPPKARARNLPPYPGFFSAVTSAREEWLEARRDDPAEPELPNSRDSRSITFIDEIAGWPWPALRSQMRAAVREAGAYDVQELDWGIALPPSSPRDNAASVTRPIHNARLTALPLRPVWRGFIANTLVFGAMAWGVVAFTRFALGNVRLDRTFARSVVAAALLGAIVTYLSAWACAIAPRLWPPPPTVPGTFGFNLGFFSGSNAEFTERRWPWSVTNFHPAWGLTRIKSQCYARGRVTHVGSFKTDLIDIPWFLPGAIDRREQWLDTQFDAPATGTRLSDLEDALFDLTFIDELAGWPLPALRTEMRTQGPIDPPVEALRWGIPLPASVGPNPGIAPPAGTRPVANRGLTALPLLPVFFINTALASILLWIPIFGFTIVRRTRRVNHNRCERCGYDRRAHAPTDPCPECALVPRLLPTETGDVHASAPATNA